MVGGFVLCPSRLPVRRTGFAGAQDLPAVPLPSVPSRFPLLIVLGTVAASLLIWLGVLGLQHQSRQARMALALAHNAQLSQLLAEHANRSFRVVDAAMERAAPMVTAGWVDRASLETVVSQTGMAGQTFVQLSMVDAAGRFLGSNLRIAADASGQVDLSDREHIRVHLDGKSSGMFVGRPVVGRVSGSLTIQLSRAVRAPDGSLQGILVASVNPGYMLDLFRRLDPADEPPSLVAHGSALLFSLDGLVLAGIDGQGKDLVGADIAGAPTLVASRAARSGAFEGADALDAAGHAIGFARVGTLPLAVSVSSNLAEIFAREAVSNRFVIAIAAVANLAIVAACLLLLATLRSLRASLEDLERSRGRAEDALRTKSDFMRAVSHEFRTPLTAISGYAELLRSRTADDLVRESSLAITHAAERLGALLERILAFAASDTSRQVRDQPVRPRAVLESVRDKFAERAAARGLWLRIELPASPLPTVRADAAAIGEILAALADNAIRFTETGGVTLRAGSDGSGAVRFEVLDTGPGVTVESAERIFEPFLQGTPEVSRTHGGIGLGLAEARRLALALGGALELLTCAPAGACFRLTLPARETAGAAAPREI